MKKSRSTDDKLKRMEKFLTRVKADSILHIISEYGFDRERIREGIILHRRAVARIDHKALKHFQKLKYTEKLNLETKRVRDQFICIIAIVRLAAKPDLLEEIGIKGQMPRKFEALLAIIGHFCSVFRANEQLRMLLQPWGVDIDGINQLDNSAFQLRSMKEQQKSMANDLMLATEEKNTALKEALIWHGDLKEICKIAFRGDPKTLEYLLN